MATAQMIIGVHNNNASPMSGHRGWPSTHATPTGIDRATDCILLA